MFKSFELVLVGIRILQGLWEFVLFGVFSNACGRSFLDTFSSFPENGLLGLCKVLK